MPRLKQKPLLSLGSRQIRLRNTSINNAPKVNTGFYQTQLGKQYRGSGIFMRGGSVRTPTAMLRRRRGKGLHLKGGKRSGKLGDSLRKRGKGWKQSVESYKENVRVIKKKYGQGSPYNAFTMMQKRMKRGGRLFGAGGHGIWKGGGGMRMRGAGLVRGPGMGRRVQRRARVI